MLCSIFGVILCISLKLHWENLIESSAPWQCGGWCKAPWGLATLGPPFFAARKAKEPQHRNVSVCGILFLPFVHGFLASGSPVVGIAPEDERRWCINMLSWGLIEAFSHCIGPRCPARCSTKWKCGGGWWRSGLTPAAPRVCGQPTRWLAASLHGGTLLYVFCVVCFRLTMLTQIYVWCAHMHFLSHVNAAALALHHGIRREPQAQQLQNAPSNRRRAVSPAPIRPERTAVKWAIQIETSHANKNPFLRFANSQKEDNAKHQSPFLFFRNSALHFFLTSTY